MVGACFVAISNCFLGIGWVTASMKCKQDACLGQEGPVYPEGQKVLSICLK